MQHAFNKKIFLLGSIFGLAFSFAYGQDRGAPDSNQEINQLISPENQATREDEAPEVPAGPADNVTPKELSDLGRLAPFSDIAVIQRRFLPKTSRFELTPAAGMILNDVFFLNPILSGRLAFYFSEQFGLEAGLIAFSSSAKKVVKDLDSRRVTTDGLAFPENYYGLDLKWSPVYGKMGFFNQSVVPFDLFFLLGGGVTNTNQKTSPTTIHVGTGQMFAMAKWLAFRWDLGGYWYTSKSSSVSTGDETFLNLHFTVGLSFFFPGASYR